jgi:hypothetical protein
MSETVAVLVAFLAAFAGLAALALGRPPRGKAAPPRFIALASQVCGIIFLLAAFFAAIAGWGLSVGLVAAIGLSSLASLSLIFLLAFLPRLLPPLAGLSLLAAVVLAAVFG